MFKDPEYGKSGGQEPKTSAPSWHQSDLPTSNCQAADNEQMSPVVNDLRVILEEQ